MLKYGNHNHITCRCKLSFYFWNSHYISNKYFTKTYSIVKFEKTLLLFGRHHILRCNIFMKNEYVNIRLNIWRSKSLNVTSQSSVHVKGVFIEPFDKKQ